jgi:hypothetical protein
MIITASAKNISSRVLPFGAGGYATESLVIAGQHQLPSVVDKLLIINTIPLSGTSSAVAFKPRKQPLITQHRWAEGFIEHHLSLCFSVPLLMQ